MHVEEEEEDEGSESVRGAALCCVFSPIVLCSCDTGVSEFCSHVSTLKTAKMLYFSFKLCYQHDFVSLKMGTH